MRFETYEKAEELMSKMDYLSRLESVFQNACKQKYLAAIGDCEFDTPLNICVTKCKVLNHETLTDDIREKLLYVIREEYDMVREEFEAL